MRKSAHLAVCAMLACLALPSVAAWVAEKDASNVAAAFIANDAIGQAVLPGRSVGALARRGNLWIVPLSPSGHVIVAASDISAPIVGFSKKDFAEPDPNSPAYAYLAGVDASLAGMEAKGGERHARWDRLLCGGGKKGGTRGADSPSAVIVPPILESHYNQWQPYNDYSPVYAADTAGLGTYGAYRGRCPCGCVATAAVQGFRHFRWPARIDRVDSFSHSFTDGNGLTTAFPLRFDGHLPIDWDSLHDEYEPYIGGYDLRGKVAEAVRHPIARLLMFADVLAHMAFGVDGSAANYETVASNASEWYTAGTRVAPTDPQVQADIASGVPVQVTVPGHAVVGHGWAAEGAESYIYINYGWGGDNDGYYNINDSTIQSAYVGHYPRAKPQMDPLPRVCATNLTLNWHFPDFYTNSLSGFTVSFSKTATTPSTFLDDFSASSGTPSSGLFAVGEDSLGYDGKLLYALSNLGSSYFTFPGRYTLTSASALTFRLRSNYALGNSFEVQARFDNGDWTTLLAPELNDNGVSGWSTESVNLGGHGGQTVQFRLFKTFPGGSYYPNVKCILVDDFCVTDVLAPVAPEVRTVGKTARSLALTGLEASAAYSFAVTPSISGALVDGETSEPVLTSIAGTGALGMPEIRSVSSVSEGFYRECGLGTTTFYVECSETVTSLSARPSHLALVGDGDVAVTPNGNGRFTVRVSPSGVTAANARSRMILTLAATDSNGTTAYRDLSLRFAPVDSSAVTVTATTSSGDSFTVDVPYEWIDQYALVPSGSSASAYEGALAGDADADGDGCPNWAEYVCGSSPIDPSSKLIATIRIENGQPIIGYESPHGIAAGFKAVVKGTDDLTEDFSLWQVTTGTTSLHYFRVEIVPE